MKKAILSAFVLYVLIACSGTGERQKQFERIYDLITEYDLDSAQAELNRIDTAGLNTYESVLFKFHHIIIRYKKYEPSPDTSALNACIKAFAEHGDKQNLCRSYTYKANILTEMGKKDEAILYLKEAEELVKKTGDKETEMRIYSSISHINIISANMNAALEYADRVLKVASMTGNKRWMARGLDEKGIAFGHLGRTDSSAFYEKAAVPYLSSLPRQERAQVMNNIALAYSSEHNYDSADFYFRKSLEAFPMHHVYGNLAVLKIDRHDEDSVEMLFRKSFGTEYTDVRIYLMNKYTEWLQRQRRFEEASALGLEIKSLYDSLALIQKAEQMKVLQEDYDKQVLEQQGSKRERRWLAAVVISMLLLIAIYAYYRAAVKKNRDSLTQMKAKTAALEADLDRLHHEGKENEREAKALRRRTEQLKKEMSDIIARGKQRFESLTKGSGNVTEWRKSDFVDAIEYYSMVQPQAMKHIEDNYKGLSVTQILYLQLSHYGIDDSRLKTIFHLSDGAMRTMKSRINRKKTTT